MTLVNAGTLQSVDPMPVRGAERPALGECFPELRRRLTVIADVSTQDHATSLRSQEERSPLKHSHENDDQTDSAKHRRQCSTR